MLHAAVEKPVLHAAVQGQGHRFSHPRWNRFKANSGEISESWDGARMGFPECIDCNLEGSGSEAFCREQKRAGDYRRLPVLHFHP